MGLWTQRYPLSQTSRHWILLKITQGLVERLRLHSGFERLR